MQNLWRILYSPQSVYDELSSGLQIVFPLLAVLGVVALSTLVTETNPFSILTAPLGWAIYMALLGTGFLIVGKICKSDHKWGQWFGFAAWAQVPLILVTALDVLLAVLTVESKRIYLFTVAEGDVFLTTSSIWWVWSYIISIQGLRSWTSKNMGPCIGLALVPQAMFVLPALIFILAIISLSNSLM